MASLSSLNSQLYEEPRILVESGVDTSRVNEIKEHIVKSEHGLANFMSRYIPQAGRFLNKGTYFIRRLGRRLGGVYNPSDDSLQINPDQSSTHFREESVVHEKIHFYQKVGGALEGYWNGLVNNLGLFGAMLYKPIIEGGASYLTQLYRGENSEDAYGPYRAGAREVAHEYGAGVLVNPPKNPSKIMKITGTFVKGMMNYLRSNPRSSYA